MSIERKIQAHLSHGTVIFVFKTGSWLFVRNFNDKDIVAVVENFDRNSGRMRIDEYDIFLYSVEEFTKMATISLGDYRDRYSLAVAMASNPDNVLYGQNPILDYNWFDYRERILSTLSHSLDHDLVNKTNNEMCPPNMIWDFATFYAICTNTTELNDGLLYDIQIVYDNIMPKERAFELKEMIRGL